MVDQVTYFQNPKTNKLVFFLSLLVSLFWIAGRFLNIYSIAIVGGIFEILWFPIAALTLILPITAFIFWGKERFILKSLYPASLLLIVLTILVITFY